VTAAVGLVKDYLNLTKPRIILLVLVTTWAGMRAAGAPAAAGLLLATLLGTAMAAGAANALNCYLDRDVDALMVRTRNRPLPAGRVPPPGALAFGLGLGILAVALLGTAVNWLAAALAGLGVAFYVLVYTKWLKRSTPKNIVIGGAAGAVGPIIGWAAATGRLDFPALVLFAIIFFWTPPHFWALALVRKDDYARAGIPMLPVVSGEAATRRQIVGYTLALVAVSILPVPLAAAGRWYLTVAVVSGALFLGLAVRAGREGAGPGRATRQLYGYSIIYLAALFVALVADCGC